MTLVSRWHAAGTNAASKTSIIHRNDFADIQVIHSIQLAGGILYRHSQKDLPSLKKDPSRDIKDA
jgi:hypothetical protein